MMEEPYRWVEAIRNRREYVDDQLREVSPVVGLCYADGVLLLTTSPGPRKIFEVHDRIAFAGVGHPADIEKLRRSVTDAAHLEAFNLSPADVSLRRLVSFGLGPLMKSAFDEIFRSPFVARVLMAELGADDGIPCLYTVEADGSFAPAGPAASIGGSPVGSADMVEYLQSSVDGASLSVGQALDAALRAWSLGKLAAVGEESPDDERIASHLRTALPEARIEAAVLDRTVATHTRFRLLGTEPLREVVAAYSG